MLTISLTSDSREKSRAPTIRHSAERRSLKLTVRRVSARPELGFFNIHPCINDGWPSRYAGPNPFKALLDDGHDHAKAALHRIDEGFDTGELLAMSGRIAMPPNATVIDMHKITSPMFARFAITELVKLSKVRA